MRTTIRTLCTQAAAAAAGGVVAVALVGGSFAYAQEAPESGAGVAEAVAAPNSVNSAAIINGSVGRGDIKPGVLTSWAHVAISTSTATLQDDRGVATATFITNGQYKVTFDRSIEHCAWTATLNDADSGSAEPGEVTVERDTAVDAFSLRVRTYDSAGNPGAPGSSDAFSVTADC